MASQVNTGKFYDWAQSYDAKGVGLWQMWQALWQQARKAEDASASMKRDISGIGYRY